MYITYMQWYEMCEIVLLLYFFGKTVLLQMMKALLHFTYIGHSANALVSLNS